MQTLLRNATIVTMDRSHRIIDSGGILVEGKSVQRVLSAEDLRQMDTSGTDVVDATGLTVIPGFVQTHIHLCQTLFRGLADDLELLDWLRLRIFPLEAAHDASSMYASARAGLAELIRSGTTTILDMGSVHHEEEVVRAVDESGIRAFVGKSMIDINDLYPGLKEPTADALSSTLRQAGAWHGSGSGRIRYAVAPRFVLSCSEELLREAYAMTKDFPGMLFHTHAAENRGEMAAVRDRCRMDNIEYFESLGILHPNTCLAHCIWLSDWEIDLMAERKARVAHCPSSNLKLASGIANIPGLLRRGVTVSLGADGAPCNNTLDMFEEMRLAALIQKPQHGPGTMDAQTVFSLATTGGAAALGVSNEVGSIEAGKRADLVLLDLSRVWNSYAARPRVDIYSAIVYGGSPENVHGVMIDGSWVMRNRSLLRVDEAMAVADARQALRSLLGRVRLP